MVEYGDRTEGSLWCFARPDKKHTFPLIFGHYEGMQVLHALIMRALAGYIFAPALHEGKLPSS